MPFVDRFVARSCGSPRGLLYVALVALLALAVAAAALSPRGPGESALAAFNPGRAASSPLAASPLPSLSPVCPARFVSFAPSLARCHRLRPLTARWYHSRLVAAGSGGVGSRRLRPRAHRPFAARCVAPSPLPCTRRPSPPVRPSPVRRPCVRRPSVAIASPHVTAASSQQGVGGLPAIELVLVVARRDLLYLVVLVLLALAHAAVRPVLHARLRLRDFHVGRPGVDVALV